MGERAGHKGDGERRYGERALGAEAVFGDDVASFPVLFRVERRIFSWNDRQRRLSSSSA